MIAPASELQLARESARAWREAFLGGLQPSPRITVSEWADQNRLLTTRSSSEPGPWRTARTPYLREIMDCLSTSSPVEEVVFVKGSQLGGTEVGNNWLGYIIDHAPGPVMAVMPTEGAQRRKSRQSLDALIEDTPRLAAKVATRKSRDPGNTTLMKVFPGGMLALASANSGPDLRSMSCRYLFLDEVDGFPQEIEGEGDPDELAERGTRNFPGRKIFRVSTPTITGRSRIERRFLETDRRYYQVPCPHCEKLQRITWNKLHWDKEPDELPERVALELREGRRVPWMECEYCHAHVEEHWKDKMLAEGVWIPEDPSLGGKVRGYHLSALYSPLGMYSWSQSIARLLRAKGQPARLRVWANQDLGESWKESGDAPEWRTLHERRERYKVGRVPRGGLLLTAGVDVQGDRLEYEVMAWGPDLESWSVEYVVHPGAPTNPDTFAELDRLLTREYSFEDGGPPARIAGLGIDTGFETSHVYAWVRRFGRSARVFALKGRTGTHVLVGVPSPVEVEVGGRRIPRGIRVWPVDSGLAKEELYSRLELRPPVAAGIAYPPGFCHFPQYGPEFFQGMTAEVLVRKALKGGRIVLEWQKTRERNEPLDCRVYGRAAAYILGADRWSRQDWKAVREVVRRMSTAAPKEEAAPPPAPPSPDQPGRRRSSRWDRFKRRT